jgi:hypothetical protein
VTNTSKFETRSRVTTFIQEHHVLRDPPRPNQDPPDPRNDQSAKPQITINCRGPKIKDDVFARSLACRLLERQPCFVQTHTRPNPRSFFTRCTRGYPVCPRQAWKIPGQSAEQVTLDRRRQFGMTTPPGPSNSRVKSSKCQYMREESQRVHYEGSKTDHKTGVGYQGYPNRQKGEAVETVVP